MQPRFALRLAWRGGKRMIHAKFCTSVTIVSDTPVKINPPRKIKPRFQLPIHVKVNGLDFKNRGSVADLPTPPLSSPLLSSPPLFSEENPDIEKARKSFGDRISRCSHVMVPFAPVGSIVSGDVVGTSKDTTCCIPVQDTDSASTSAQQHNTPYKHQVGEARTSRFAVVEPRSMRIVESGPHAATPACPHYGKCGGCAFQSTAYQTQLDMKHTFIQRCFASHGLHPAIQPVYDACTRLQPDGSHAPYSYRNRADFSLSALNSLSIGFKPFRLPFERWSDRIVQVSACRLLGEAANRTLQWLRSSLGEFAGGEGGADVAAVISSITVRAGRGADDRPAVLVVFHCMTEDLQQYKPLAEFVEMKAKETSPLDDGEIGFSFCYHPTSIPKPIQRELKLQAAEAVGRLAIAAGRYNNILTSLMHLALQSRYLSGKSLNAGTVKQLYHEYRVDALHMLNTWGICSRSAEPVSSASFRSAISPLAFTQPNNDGAAAIMSTICAMTIALKARGLSTDVAWDLFCGGGSLGMSMVISGVVKKSIGIDCNLQAIQDAVATCSLLGVKPEQAKFHCLDLLSVPIAPPGQLEEEALEVPASIYLSEEGSIASTYQRLSVCPSGAILPEPDVAVVDPPRAGIGKNMTTSLLRYLPPAIIYVSCNPETLAADTRHLVDAGYSVVLAQPIDQFAHTQHTECVVLLLRDAALSAWAAPQ